MPKKINVRKLRERLNMTQQELADKLGTHQSTVHKFEQGKMEPSKPVQKLLEAIAEQS